MQVRGFLFYNFLHAGRVPGVLKNLNPSHMGLPFFNPYPQKKKKKTGFFGAGWGVFMGFCPPLEVGVKDSSMVSYKLYGFLWVLALSLTKY
jgi:hypothetical protein